MNFDRKHAPDAKLIAQPVDPQSSALPLCYGCPCLIALFVLNECDSELTDKEVHAGLSHFLHLQRHLAGSVGTIYQHERIVFLT